MKFNEKTVSENYLYKGKNLNLRKDQIILHDDKGSCILCENDGKILLVKQFRYPYKEELLELPAGKLNPGEDPMQTAIRELEEEGGVKAESVELMFEVYPSPGYTDEIIRIYKATNITKTCAHLDEDEFLECVWVEKSKLKEMIKNKEIRDGKTLIALLSIL